MPGSIHHHPAHPGERVLGVYWPALIPATEVEHTVVLPDGTRQVITPPAGTLGPETQRPWSEPVHTSPASLVRDGPTVRAPLGRVCAARSGDKGGNANVGVWTRDAAAFGWLRGYLTSERLRPLLPEAKGSRCAASSCPT